MNKRIKDLFYISAGGDISSIQISEELNKEFIYPVYSNALKNEGLYCYSNNYRIKKESLTITARGNIGFSFLRKPKFNAIGRLLVLTPKNNKFNIKYINYILSKNDISYNKTAIPQLTSIDIGDKIISINNSIEIQDKIVSFLDKNCEKIEKEISLLEKKSELLEEYKQSLIFETVTKGLDKNAEMKDSGIKFIGIIPNNWRIFRIKDLFNISRGRVIAASTLEKDSSDILKYPVFSAATENDGIIGYLERYDFNNNLLTWTTDGAKAGAVFIRSGKFNCTNVCGILRAKYKNNNLKFQKYALSIQTQNYQRPDINGAKIMSNEMANILIAQPELYEQTLISNFLDIETKKIEDEIKLINEKIELLKEYKQSLIYEAVTGQLDIE